MQLLHLQNQPCPFPLHGDEAITFSVLSHILRSPCSHIFTDKKDVMICLSTLPYPVWVWCRDPDDPDAVAAIADCLRENFPLEKDFSYNISYPLLGRLRAFPGFEHAQIKINMLSYKLDACNPLARPCPGRLARATMAQLDTLTPLQQAAHLEMTGESWSLEACRESLAAKIQDGHQFLWQSESGEIVAIAGERISGSTGCVTGVYTLPAHRRQGYALNLISALSKRLLADGLTPTLYTDADYAASNACYQKIGYRQIGRLCTVSAGT